MNAQVPLVTEETIRSFKLCIEGAEIARKQSRHENASKAKSFASLMGVFHMLCVYNLA